MHGKPNLNVSEYLRRQPEKNVLHQVIRENWLTFKDTTEQSGRTLPVYVQKEFERLIDCGVQAVAIAGWSPLPAKVARFAHPASADT